MKWVYLCLLFLGSSGARAQDAQTILKSIDRNTFSESVEMTTSMTIHGERGTRTIKARSWAEGDKKSFTEFLSPPREKGVKMLKLDQSLWTYYPSADRTVKIAGHMLRQSVMGSDLSYEDMLEDRKLEEIYTPKVVGEEKVSDRDCHILELTAKSDDIAYQKKKLWVDKERMIPLKEEMYASSGKILKEVTVHKVEKVKDRWYAMHVTYKDKLQAGKGTELEIHSIAFDQKIPPSKFQKSALRR